LESQSLEPDNTPDPAALSMNEGDLDLDLLETEGALSDLSTGDGAGR
jgi:hypothetical protein